MDFLKVGVPVRWLIAARHHIGQASVHPAPVRRGAPTTIWPSKIHECVEFDEGISRCPAVDFLSYNDDAAISNGSQDEEIAIEVAARAMVKF
eukprot:5885511-Pyramimonas_sp.AAC.1